MGVDTHMCMHLCVSCVCWFSHHVSTCGDQRLTSECLLQSFLYLNFQLFYFLLLLLLMIIFVCMMHGCECGHTSAMVEVKGPTSRSLLSPSILSSRDQTQLIWVLRQALLCMEPPTNPPPNFLRHSLSLNFCHFGQRG